MRERSGTAGASPLKNLIFVRLKRARAFDFIFHVTKPITIIATLFCFSCWWSHEVGGLILD
jgi:hypothetical protein